MDLGEYTKDFVEAATYSLMMSDIDDAQKDTIKLNNLEQSHATKISNIFGKFVKGGSHKIYYAGNDIFDIIIIKEHYKHIIEFFKKYVDIINKQQNAMLLFTLSAVFTRYSSNNHFGNNKNSPIAVRNYALVLFNKAIKIDPQILNIDQIDNYKKRFIGIGGEYASCTEMISNMMKDHIINSKIDEWKKMLKIAIPQYYNWQEWIK